MAEVTGFVRIVPTAHADTPRPPTQVREVKEGKEGFQASTFEQLEQDFQEVRILRLRLPFPSLAAAPLTHESHR